MKKLQFIRNSEIIGKVTYKRVFQKKLVILADPFTSLPSIFFWLSFLI